MSGRTYWGVDVGLRRISIASKGDELHVVSAATTPKTKIGQALVDLAFETRAAADELLVISGVPTAVVVESPFGRFPNPSLQYAAGVILETLARMFGEAVHALPSTQWKIATVGKGNAKKPEVMEWAKANGYTGESQDEADAVCIAIATERLTEVLSETP